MATTAHSLRGAGGTTSSSAQFNTVLLPCLLTLPLITPPRRDGVVVPGADQRARENSAQDRLRSRSTTTKHPDSIPVALV